MSEEAPPQRTEQKEVKKKKNLIVDRPLYTEDDLSDQFNLNPFRREYRAVEIVSKQARKNCSSKYEARESFFSKIPFIKIFKGYNVKTDLFGDAVAGLTVGIMNIPQGKLIFYMELGAKYKC